MDIWTLWDELRFIQRLGEHTMRSRPLTRTERAALLGGYLQGLGARRDAAGLDLKACHDQAQSQMRMELRLADLERVS